MTRNNGTALPQFPQSYWRDSLPLPSFPGLAQDLQVDVAVVGAGIAGITTAYLLVQEGLRVALIDAGKILDGTTGHTTAKVTAQHDLIYAELIRTFGAEQAGRYYQAQQNAVAFVADTVQARQIACDFSPEDAYVYAASAQDDEQLQAEYRAYQTLAIPGAYGGSVSLPFPVTATLTMPNQAQFHPLKYLFALVRCIMDAGGLVFEDTQAVDIETGARSTVVTAGGQKIACNKVVVATHFPFYEGLGLYFARMHAERSYVLAIRPEQAFPRGMYISAGSPKRSLRWTDVNGDKLLLVGGESHKTGQGIATIRHYETLQAFAQGALGIREIAYRWSAQDLVTLDILPYIGQLTPHRQDVFVATGFGKWGMSGATAAALLLRDLIMERANPYRDLVTPARFHAEPDVKTAVTNTVDAVKHLVSGKFEIIRKRPEELGIDQGAVVTVRGKRAGAYRDTDGNLHIVDTTCTHMGCELAWNDGERTWDCPCHGSRFAADGQVIEGPATIPLKRLEL